MIINNLKKKIKGKNIKIIYTEGLDERILKGAYEIYRNKLGIPILVGNKDTINKKLKSLKIKNIFQIIDPQNSDKINEFSSLLYNLRKDKGLSLNEAQNLVKQPNYFGTFLLNQGYADCLISGASYNTAQTLHPALQIIKPKKEEGLVSSYFIMIINKKEYFFADCSFIPNPTSQQLAQIAIQTNNSIKQFGIKPIIAFLSYSSFSSSSGQSVDLVKKAVEIAKSKIKDSVVDGEIQLDAAIDKEVAKIKCPNSKVKGNANTLIFPSLDSGNIGYKLVQRFANARAIGPISQGFNKSVHVLSRGCSKEDVIDVSSIAIFDALNQKGQNNQLKLK